MAQQRSQRQATALETKQLLRQWFTPFVVVWLTLIVLSTLFPFDFGLREGFSLGTAFRFFEKTSVPFDSLRNILLFMPLGFGLAGITQSKFKALTAATITVVSSILLSVTVESIQLFLPTRDPSFGDMLANSIGGFVGFWGFYISRPLIVRVLSHAHDRYMAFLTVRNLAACFIGYFVLHGALALTLQTMTTFHNWDPDLPLLIGNEKTADRAWNGSITSVQMANEALSDAEVEQSLRDRTLALPPGASLVASYTFEQTVPNAAQSSPALSWNVQPIIVSDKGAAIDQSHWLTTKTPATALIKSLQETSQVTISAILASNSPNQTGPTRILSISKDAFHRNLTLGQEGKALVIRLRTPITGKNGKYPELRIPDAFADQEQHHFIVTYDGHRLRAYQDHLSPSYTIAFTPEITFFRCLFFLYDHWDIALGSIAPFSYKVLYLAIVFVPLGILLGQIVQHLKGGLPFYVLIALLGTVFPPILLAGTLAIPAGMGLDPTNVLLGVAILAAMVVLICWQKFAVRPAIAPLRAR